MLIQSNADLDMFLNWVGQQKIIAMDTETTGLSAYRGDRLAGISVAGENTEEVFYLPFRHGAGQNLNLDRLPEVIRCFNEFHQSGRHIVFWNAKFDVVMMHFDGLEIPRPALPGQPTSIEDAMIAAHLMNENEPNFALKNTADRYQIGRGSLDEDDLIDVVKARFTHTPDGKKITNKNWKSLIWKLEPEVVAAYAETDAVLTMLMRQFYTPHLVQWDLCDLYFEQCDYLMTLTRMELRGILLDVERLLANQVEAAEEAEKIQKYLRELTGKPLFNPGSWQQLVKTFHWPNTREETLQEEAAKGDKNAQLVLDYKAWTKVNSAYYDVWLEERDENNVIRTDMNIIGTHTGRLSSRNPNLQAIPRYTNIYRVKDTVVAREGYTLIEMDLRGAELRLASHYAQEDTMGEILARDGDIHTETAESLGLERDVAKQINFSAIYGIGAKTFAQKYGYDYDTASRYLAAYHKRYPGFKRLYYSVQNVAEKKGYIRLDTGRIRRYRVRGMIVAETHKASSNWVQGTVGEVMRISMNRLDVAMDGHDAHLLLTVHDSLLAEVPDDQVDHWLCMMACAMTDFAFDPPLNVEAKVGKRWGELKKVEIPKWATWRPTKHLPGSTRPPGEPTGFCWWKHYGE